MAESVLKRRTAKVAQGDVGTNSFVRDDDYCHGFWKLFKVMHHFTNEEVRTIGSEEAVTPVVHISQYKGKGHLHKGESAV